MSNSPVANETTVSIVRVTLSESLIDGEQVQVDSIIQVDSTVYLQVDSVMQIERDRRRDRRRRLFLRQSQSNKIVVNAILTVVGKA